MSSGAPHHQPLAPAPGTMLCGKYRVERSLGSGGMGVVVLARHLRLDRPVAIKLLPAAQPGDPYRSARVLREARAMARLTSEHVVRVLDLDELPGGAPVLVMELLEGADLERVLEAGPVAPARAVDFALQACAALAEAHARGIVHRDVKPGNLFLVPRADGAELIKLLDFGISKVADDELRLTQTSAGLGSPLFMSPEQLLAPSRVDARTDVWSLGVTLYRLLSGQAPFDAKELSALSAQIAAQPPRPLLEVAPDLSPALAAVVMRCLEKDVAARWPDVVALAQALEPFRAPGALGRADAVVVAEAVGRRAGAAVTEAAAVEVQPSAGPRTLSHDVPRWGAVGDGADGAGGAPGASAALAAAGVTNATGAAGAASAPGAAGVTVATGAAGAANAADAAGVTSATGPAAAAGAAGVTNAPGAATATSSAGAPTLTRTPRRALALAALGVALVGGGWLLQATADAPPPREAPAGSSTERESPRPVAAPPALTPAPEEHGPAGQPLLTAPAPDAGPRGPRPARVVGAAPRDPADLEIKE